MSEMEMGVGGVKKGVRMQHGRAPNGSVSVEFRFIEGGPLLSIRLLSSPQIGRYFVLVPYTVPS